MFLKIFIKWQVLKILLSVLNIDKPHKDGTLKSEIEIKYRSSLDETLCLRHCATSWKVASLRPYEVNFFFSIYLILSAALGPGSYSASNRNEYQKQTNNASWE
jgi:hypothetical protein